MTHNKFQNAPVIFCEILLSLTGGFSYYTSALPFPAILFTIAI